MQKNNKNASILIWSIFLSLILSITFINISSKINENIKKNWNYVNKISSNNLINNKLKNKDYSNETFNSNNENIDFKQVKNYLWTLKKDENIKIKLVQTSDISINIKKWWPILYTTLWSLISSWIIISNTWFTLNWSIILDNLAWYTKFEINSNNNMITPEVKYKVIKTIWNKNVVKTKWTINN